MPDTITRRSATLAPETFDARTGTVDAVLSTGAPVRRTGFTERLGITRDNVTVAPRLPILDTHRQGSISDILGRVEAVRFEPGAVVATLRITSPQARDAIERGDLHGVSIGYRVDTWAESRDANGPVRTATKWTLAEVSLVPIPADPGSTFRSENMPDPVPTPTPPTPTPPPALTTRAEVNVAIRSLATRHALPATWADTLIDGDATLEAARASALEALEERSARLRVRPHQNPDDTVDANHLEHRSEALAHRMAPGIVPLTDASRPYLHFSLRDHARDLLRLAGVSTTAMSPDELFRRAMETISDFPGLLSSSGNRMLAPPYLAAISPFRLLFRDATSPDFRPLTRLSLSEAPELKKVNEAGEITYGSRAESLETYALSTFGRLFSLSRQAIINDNLGAFASWSRDAAYAAAEMENGERIKLLLANSGAGETMEDGQPLFHASHGNLMAAAALSVTSLDLARIALRTQKGLDGRTPVGVAPMYLLVGPANETLAEQVCAALNPVVFADVNPFGGSLKPLVEARITGKAWYVAADPAQRPAFEQAKLAGAPAPVMESRTGWETLGVEYRVFEDFGCGTIDWRGIVMNPGA
jgi:hypothetical protein